MAKSGQQPLPASKAQREAGQGHAHHRQQRLPELRKMGEYLLSGVQPDQQPQIQAGDQCKTDQGALQLHGWLIDLNDRCLCPR